MLGKLSEPISHADWPHKLLQAEHALNNSVHSTTKQTPSDMLFSVRQRGQVIDELTENLEARVSPSRDLQGIGSYRTIPAVRRGKGTTAKQICKKVQSG